MTLPAMVNGKQRRPPNMRDIPAYDDYGDIATFEFREDAVAAGRPLEAARWIISPQYVARWDRWTLWRSRKSWGYSKTPQMVKVTDL